MQFVRVDRLGSSEENNDWLFDFKLVSAVVILHVVRVKHSDLWTLRVFQTGGIGNLSCRLTISYQGKTLPLKAHLYLKERLFSFVYEGLSRSAL
ncbi:hypothetical protein BDR03DRAFT_521842 [Suillus americanus]|nr:hypothetical protein BDR03DRAFT_521842 [Suillus americanus]